MSETKTPQSAQSLPGPQSAPPAQPFQGPQTVEAFPGLQPVDPYAAAQGTQPGLHLQPVDPSHGPQTTSAPPSHAQPEHTPFQAAHLEPVPPARQAPPVQPAPPTQPAPPRQASHAQPVHTLQYRFDGPQDAPVLVIGPSLGTTWHRL